MTESLIFNLWKRMEKVNFKERSSVAKVMGTVLSLVGAPVVVLYHGPRVFVASSPPYLHFRQLSPSLFSSNSDWIIGGCLLTIKDIFVSISFILQVLLWLLQWLLHLKMLLSYILNIDQLMIGLTYTKLIEFFLYIKHQFIAIFIIHILGRHI